MKLLFSRIRRAARGRGARGISRRTSNSSSLRVRAGAGGSAIAAQSEPVHSDPRVAGRVFVEADPITCRLRATRARTFGAAATTKPDIDPAGSAGAKENFMRALRHGGLRARHEAALTRSGRSMLARWTRGSSDSIERRRCSMWTCRRDWLRRRCRLLCRLPHGDVSAVQCGRAPAARRIIPPSRAGISGLEAIDAWRDPFSGLEAPGLPRCRLRRLELCRACRQEPLTQTLSRQGGRGKPLGAAYSVT